MSIRSAGILVVLLSIAAPAQAGFYNTFDNLEETRWSQDFDVFRRVLDDLNFIRAAKPDRNPPIRQRYMLMEALGNETNLKTLEDKLNYSVVLMRRGKADQAVQLLKPMADGEFAEDFLVQSHCATAHFLAGNADLRSAAGDYMKQALDNWPKHWDDVKGEARLFMRDEHEFKLMRKFEAYFQRLIRSRLKEDRLRAKNQPVPETIDPIFVDEKGTPLKFLIETGKFEVGRIASAEYEILRKDDAIEAVEQLLIWMPSDQRLLWLLGEVMNASAMNPNLEDEPKHKAIRNAYKVFASLDKALVRLDFGREAIKARHEALASFVAQLPPERQIDPTKFGLPPDKGPEETSYRPIIIGVITGFAVGLFALWQFQEMRRRRQTRAASK